MRVLEVEHETALESMTVVAADGKRINMMRVVQIEHETAVEIMRVVTVESCDEEGGEDT